jgi:predicted ATP-dependent endonuclease of OLD family
MGKDMFKLKSATINKYKSYTEEQTVNIEPDITTLVGKNESGKTAFLEALAKSNYFTDDENFKFDEVHDFPRNELKKHQRSGEELEVIVCTYEIDDQTLKDIESDLCEGVLSKKEFSVATKYKGSRTWRDVDLNEKLFLESLEQKLELTEDQAKKVVAFGTVKKLVETEFTEEDELQPVKKYLIDNIINRAHDWNSKLDGFIVKNYFAPRLPRYWYFDEYHELPSRVSVDAIRSNHTSAELTQQQLDTAKALFELAVIDIDKLANSTSFESFIAELEATSNEITDQIFEYWSTNNQLAIEFKIEHKHRGNNRAPEKILDIRVRNNKHRVSLPLKNRSKGFNWFFSFIVWFSKIQDEKDKNFILLLDEPGLNLHASAQADLLRFINDLSSEYQLIYSTHSPFMVESDALHRVRTVYDSDDGSKISEAIQEKDPDTLFPLQAALGYDIAQNLFVSKNNLLVEGPSDLNYLTYMSSLLESQGREGLKDDVTIVPVGGLDKVCSFISLLRGSKLKIACLLDTFNNDKGAQRLKDLVAAKIVKDNQIRFFDEFVNDDCKKADIEDMFSKPEYLNVFNAAYPDFGDIKEADLDANKPKILDQLKGASKGKKYNHYKPSQCLLGMGLTVDDFSEETLTKFESMFKEVNKLF